MKWLPNTCTMGSHSPLKVSLWNANKIIEFNNFLIKNDIHICLISETWLKQRDNLSMQNYKIYRKDRFCSNPKRNPGGGVAIAIRNDIPHFELPDVSTQVIESIGLEVYDLQFYSVYFPGSKNAQNLAHFKNDISKFTSNSKKYVIGGDLNSKHRFWNCFKGNKAGSILYNEMISHDFVLMYPPTPTYFPPQANRTLPSTIDIAVTNIRIDMSTVHAQNALSSDHIPVVFEVDCNITQRLIQPTVRCYAKADWRLFKKTINDNK